jgi:hypothetical protein
MIRMALLVIASIAIPATVLDRGPFVSGVLHHSLLSLCTFLAISSILAWVLATEEEPGLEESYAWTPILTLLACMALTVGAWSWIARDTETRTRERFQRAADAVRETIRVRMEAYESLLRAGTSLFDASRNVERGEWQKFVAGLDLEVQYPGVLGMGFARFAPGPALDALKREVAVWPEGKRDLYAAIVYLEPPSPRNRFAVGYDMMSEPTRRRAMVAAMRPQAGRFPGLQPGLRGQCGRPAGVARLHLQSLPHGRPDARHLRRQLAGDTGGRAFPGRGGAIDVFQRARRRCPQLYPFRQLAIRPRRRQWPGLGLAHPAYRAVRCHGGRRQIIPGAGPGHADQLAFLRHQPQSGP